MKKALLALITIIALGSCEQTVDPYEIPANLVGTWRMKASIWDCPPPLGYLYNVCATDCKTITFSRGGLSFNSDAPRKITISGNTISETFSDYSYYFYFVGSTLNLTYEYITTENCTYSEELVRE